MMNFEQHKINCLHFGVRSDGRRLGIYEIPSGLKKYIYTLHESQRKKNE